MVGTRVSAIGNSSRVSTATVGPVDSRLWKEMVDDDNDDE